MIPILTLYLFHTHFKAEETSEALLSHTVREIERLHSRRFKLHQVET